MNRAVQFLQKNARLLRPAARGLSTSAPRQSGHQWLYRESGKKYIPEKHFLIAEGIGALTFYWILIHLWHEPEHILGDFPYPDPSKWTNDELGISE